VSGHTVKLTAVCLPAPPPLPPAAQTTSFGALLDVVLDILLRGWLWVNALPASIALLLPLLEMMVFAVTHKVRKGLRSASALCTFAYPSHLLPTGTPPFTCQTQGEEREDRFCMHIGWWCLGSASALCILGYPLHYRESFPTNWYPPPLRKERTGFHLLGGLQ